MNCFEDQKPVCDGIWWVVSGEKTIDHSVNAALGAACDRCDRCEGFFSSSRYRNLDMADYTALCGSCTTAGREEYDYLLTYKNTNHIDHTDHRAMLERGLGVSGFLSYRSQMALTAHTRGRIAAEGLNRFQTACYMENESAPRANDGQSSRAPYWPCNRTHNPATGSLASVLVLPLRQRAEVQFTALTVSTTVLSADHRSQPVDSTCLLPAGPQIIGLFSPPWRRDAGSIGPIDSSRHIAESFRSIGGVGATGRPLFLSPVSPTGMATRTKSKNLYKFSKVPSTSQKRKGEVSNGR